MYICFLSDSSELHEKCKIFINQTILQNSRNWERKFHKYFTADDLSLFACSHHSMWQYASKDQLLQSFLPVVALPSLRQLFKHRVTRSRSQILHTLVEIIGEYMRKQNSIFESNKRALWVLISEAVKHLCKCSRYMEACVFKLLQLVVDTHMYIFSQVPFKSQFKMLLSHQAAVQFIHEARTAVRAQWPKTRPRCMRDFKKALGMLSDLLKELKTNKITID